MNYYPEQEYLNAYYNDPLTPFKGKASYEPIGYEDALDGLHSRSITCTHITIIYCSYEYTHVAGPNCSEHTYPVTYTVCTLDEVEPPVIEAPDEENTGGGGSNTNPTPPNLCQPISKDGNLGDVNILGNNQDCEEEEEDQIINELKGKADCVYQKMKNNSILSKTLAKFNGQNTPVNLVLRNGDLDPGTNGETDYNLGLPMVTITLDNGASDNRPSLSVARTILHEAIHAEIFRKIKTTSGMSYDSSTRTWKLPNGSRAHFPTLFDFYNKYPDNPHHNYMAVFYRAAMVEGLKEYAKEIGKTYPESLYQDLAWVGLHESDAWKNMFADPIYTKQEQDRILKSRTDFNKTGNNECQ